MKWTMAYLILGLWGLGAVAEAQSASSISALKGPMEHPRRSWDGGWKASLSGQNYEDHQNSSALVNFRIETQFRYTLDNNLLLKVSPLARLQSGATQSSQGTLSPENKLYFREASATWRALPFAFLKAGALDQGETHTPLLLDSRPFPATRVSLLSKSSVSRFGVSAEAAVPTSVGLSTNQAEKESMPQLVSAQLRWQWTPSPLWETSIRAGVFEYRNLTTGIAADSYLLGNEADALSDTEYRFNKKYQGAEALIRSSFPLGGPLAGELALDGLQNSGAVAGENTAWRAGINIIYAWDLRTKWFGGIESFRVEPDAAVASFVDTRFSGTNRNGYAAEVGVEFGKSRSRIRAGLRESNLIYANDRQGKDRSMYIGLETGYAEF